MMDNDLAHTPTSLPQSCVVILFFFFKVLLLDILIAETFIFSWGENLLSFYAVGGGCQNPHFPGHVLYQEYGRR